MLGLLEDETGLSARALKSAGAELAKVAENLRGMLRKGEWQPGFYDGRKAVEQPGIDKTSGIVGKDLGRDLTADAEQGKFDPIIGREDEILAMMKILTGRKKENNPILVGDAGVGKTAVVEGLAQVIVSEGVMPELKGKRIPDRRDGRGGRGRPAPGSIRAKAAVAHQRGGSGPQPHPLHRRYWTP